MLKALRPKSLYPLILFYSRNKGLFLPKFTKFVCFSLFITFCHKGSLSFAAIEDAIVQKTRQKVHKKIDEFKREFGTQMMSFPEVLIGIRGANYFMEVLVDQRKTDLFSILMIVLDKFEKHKDNGRISVKSINSFKQDTVITLQVDFEEFPDPKSKKPSPGTFYLSGELTYERPNIKLIFESRNDLTDLIVATFLECYREANKPNTATYKKNNFKEVGSQNNDENLMSKISKTIGGGDKRKEEAVNKLQEFGVTLFMPDSKSVDYDWDYLAGYEKQKRDIEDTVLLALTYPTIFDEITRETRMKNEPNKPKAVLFEGPPGTGKTTSAKIIANQVNIPLIYMPLESIMSKYYGESEKKFADIFDAAKILGKAIIFIDEIDAIATSRNYEGIHEASRRVLSTLLRKIDSFESSTDVLLICATNRKQDLDPAMLSRIDLSVKFELPDKLSRAAIFKRYAKHLSNKDLEKLAELSEGLSGRNISDVCKDTERRWASKIIRKEVEEKLPSLDQYMKSISSRRSQNLS